MFCCQSTFIQTIFTLQPSTLTFIHINKTDKFSICFVQLFNRWSRVSMTQYKLNSRNQCFCAIAQWLSKSHTRQMLNKSTYVHTNTRTHTHKYACSAFANVERQTNATRRQQQHHNQNKDGRPKWTIIYEKWQPLKKFLLNTILCEYKNGEIFFNLLTLKIHSKSFVILLQIFW